jgi:hypothetical protein
MSSVVLNECFLKISTPKSVRKEQTIENDAPEKELTTKHPSIKNIPNRESLLKIAKTSKIDYW